MSETTRLLDWLAARLPLGALDGQFARFLLAKADRPSPELALAAALVCQATAAGHVCLELGAVSRGETSGLELPRGFEPPPLDRWRERLLESGVVGGPAAYQPLILERDGRLYLHRYWDYEQRLGQALLERARSREELPDLQALARDLAGLFPERPAGVDWQKVAAAMVPLRGLTVISGGPGTGKTTTVVKILALLCRQAGERDLRIALAAPTGKAAARLSEAVQRAGAALSLAQSIPPKATTLHRLLGVRSGETGFRHHADNPLPLDLLILDEASMVDVALMARLLDALPASCRLVLLGDKDQLSSVEAGAVLADLCAGCTGFSPPFAELLERLTGETLEPAPGPVGPLCNGQVTLRHSYRFGHDSPIGQLARAVNGGDAGAAESLLSQGEPAGTIGWLRESGTAEYAAQRYAPLFRLIAEGARSERLFDELEAFRLLCAVRRGPDGTGHLNRRIADLLERDGLIAPHQGQYPGRPIMVTQNDYQLGLFNGDIGLLLVRPGGDGELGVVFPGEGRELRWLAPARLPPHETVFAMTVHKSQGSEFGEVLLHLPRQAGPLISRELLYTAITRARERFLLSAPVAVLRQAVASPTRRSGGLTKILEADGGRGRPTE